MPCSKAMKTLWKGLEEFYFHFCFPVIPGGLKTFENGGEEAFQIAHWNGCFVSFEMKCVTVCGG
jgi:hypothetical protein